MCLRISGQFSVRHNRLCLQGDRVSPSIWRFLWTSEHPRSSESHQVPRACSDYAAFQGKSNDFNIPDPLVRPLRTGVQHQGAYVPRKLPFTDLRTIKCASGGATEKKVGSNSTSLFQYSLHCSFSLYLQYAHGLLCGIML